MINTTRRIETVEYRGKDIPTGKSIEQENIAMMKAADYMSNTQKGTNYKLTDKEYEEAHKELQILINKQMYGGEDE